MFTAGSIILESLCKTSVRICVWIWTVQEVSSGNQSSLNAACRDTLHLTKIIISWPFILCNFLSFILVERNNPCTRSLVKHLHPLRELFWVLRINLYAKGSRDLKRIPASHTNELSYLLILPTSMPLQKCKCILTNPNQFPFHCRYKCLFQWSFDYPMGHSLDTELLWVLPA